jgi:hypothetical protein
METVALRLPAWSAWVRRKFDDLRALAEMDMILCDEVLKKEAKS